ncbi:MAG: hypothetical protein IT428_00915 [Planctomycetaceae bacterium]|nr:hypothetical protein [Planctomycetaceae bacterium]
MIRSFLHSLIHREDDPARIDWPALITLAFYALLVIAIVGGFFWVMSSFWKDGWGPNGFN